VSIKSDHDGLVPFDNVVLGDPIHMLSDPRETLCRQSVAHCSAIGGPRVLTDY
jgi:hypothetical protein